MEKIVVHTGILPPYSKPGNICGGIKFIGLADYEHTAKLKVFANYLLT